MSKQQASPKPQSPPAAVSAVSAASTTPCTNVAEANAALAPPASDSPRIIPGQDVMKEAVKAVTSVATPPAYRKPSQAERAKPRRNVLTFSPLAWIKLLYMRDVGKTEVSGFGVALDPKYPCYIDEFHLVKQQCSSVSTEMDDEGVANFMDDMLQRGLQPFQFMRVWIHTHPKMSATPSGVDEDTFKAVFGSCDWAIMFILSQTDDAYCRVRFGAGPGGEVKLNHAIDWQRSLPPYEVAPWYEEWYDKVEEEWWPSRQSQSTMGFAAGNSNGKGNSSNFRDLESYFGAAGRSDEYYESRDFGDGRLPSDWQEQRAATQLDRGKEIVDRVYGAQIDPDAIAEDEEKVEQMTYLLATCAHYGYTFDQVMFLDEDNQFKPTSIRELFALEWTAEEIHDTIMAYGLLDETEYAAELAKLAEDDNDDRLH